MHIQGKSGKNASQEGVHIQGKSGKVRTRSGNQTTRPPTSRGRVSRGEMWAKSSTPRFPTRALPPLVKGSVHIKVAARTETCPFRKATSTGNTILRSNSTEKNATKATASVGLETAEGGTTDGAVDAIGRPLHVSAASGSVGQGGLAVRVAQSMTETRTGKAPEGDCNNTVSEAGGVNNDIDGWPRPDQPTQGEVKGLHRPTTVR